MLKLCKSGKTLLSVAAMLLLSGAACGTSVFNPAFINTAGGGGAFPVAPGPVADFVLVRMLNETSVNATFDLTVWSDVLETGDDGVVTVKTLKETFRVDTGPVAPANDVGVLFPCANSEINVLGLGGEELRAGENGVFLGGQGAGGSLGTGIESPPPLHRELGDFACGDTIIYRVISSLAADTGVKIESFVLDGSLQPSEFSGRSTFENYQRFLESQVREED